MSQHEPAAQRKQQISPAADRIDFPEVNDGVMVVQFQRGVVVALQSDTVSRERVETLKAKLIARGWIIRSWPGGARAWKGEAYPIRTSGMILKKREQLRNHPRKDLQGVAHALDLAFEL